MDADNLALDEYNPLILLKKCHDTLDQKDA